MPAHGLDPWAASRLAMTRMKRRGPQQDEMQSNHRINQDILLHATGVSIGRNFSLAVMFCSRNPTTVHPVFLRVREMHPTNDITTVVGAIRTACALTESTFLQIGETLETSIDILATLTKRFEVVLAELKGENLSQALKALTRTAAQVAHPGRIQSGRAASFELLLAQSEAIARRIAQMARSLGDVDVLAINAKIAAANIRVPGVDFSAFADEIGRTLNIARVSLANFSAELRILREHLATAHSGQVAFERHQKEAARSIAERLMATVAALSLQNRNAARATEAVRLRNAGVRKRIGEAVMALQIGDITRQRLEHTGYALDLFAASPDDGAGTYMSLGIAEQETFEILNHQLQSAQCLDAARDFDRDVTRITEALGSLAEEARTMWTLGGSAYGALDSGGTPVIATLEAEVGEALAMFERVEAAQAEIAGITATVSEAAASLRRHLQKVQFLESDIRIMGLNTTFKCARIGHEGLALSLIAQELRTYGYGFAKEASELVREVEAISTMTGSLNDRDETDGSMLVAAGMREIKDSVSTLRQIGLILDEALAELERGSGTVVTLLESTVTDLEVRDEISRVIRGAAQMLAEMASHGTPDGAELTAPTERLLASIAHGYTMASERAIYERVVGHTAGQPHEPESGVLFEVEDPLF
jgi:primosomal protein N''